MKFTVKDLKRMSIQCNINDDVVHGNIVGVMPDEPVIVDGVRKIFTSVLIVQEDGTQIYCVESLGNFEHWSDPKMIGVSMSMPIRSIYHIVLALSNGGYSLEAELPGIEV